MFGLIKRVVSVANEATKLHEIESMEKYSRKYGKVSVKLDDKEVKRSSYKTLSKKLRKL